MAEIRKEQLLVSRKAERRQKILSFLGRGFLFLLTCASAASILFVLFSIFREALPFFREVGPWALFENFEWRPTKADPSYGALGIFVGSGLVVLGSTAIAVPMGVLAAVCLSDVVPFGVRQVLKPVIELLAAIPSVAYGFFALVLFAPLLQERGGFLLATALWVVAGPLSLVAIFALSDVATGFLPDKSRKAARPLAGLLLAALAFWGLSALGGRISRLEITSGTNAMNASIILALMALPTVVSVCEDALAAVGRELRQGSYALGATRAETMIHVVMPAARGGILAAVLLGIMRAVGETMVVLMAAGNAIEIPSPWWNLLEPVRTLTATIALEMGDTVHGGEHYHALFALAFCLLLFSFALNLLSEWAARSTRLRGG